MRRFSVAREQNRARGGLDQIADRRDHAADRRDQTAENRDQTAEQRDQAAEQRDQAAEHRDQLTDPSAAMATVGLTTDARKRLGQARREAAADRRRASQDRRAGARERGRAQIDRDTALADRGASATERAWASVDDLTGVYLRGAGFVELERDIARARRTRRPLVLAFVDVDHLKGINDSRGHAAGDRMLVEVANALAAQLRPYDLIMRYGGDEFVCAISGLKLADATERLALVNAALAEGIEHGSVTVGLAELRPGDSPDDVVARADAALYQERLR